MPAFTIDTDAVLPRKNLAKDYMTGYYMITIKYNHMKGMIKNDRIF